MNTSVQDIDRLLFAERQGTKISIYVSLEQPDKKLVVLQNLIRTALRLSEKSPNSGFHEVFKQWCQKLPEELRDAKPRKSVGIFFSKNFQLILPLETQISSRVVVAESFHIKPLLYERTNQKSSYLIEFTSSGLTLHHFESGFSKGVRYFSPPIAGTITGEWPRRLDKKNLRHFFETLKAEMDHPASFVQVCRAPRGIARSVEIWSSIFDNFFIDGSDGEATEWDIILKRFHIRDRIRGLQKTIEEYQTLRESAAGIVEPEEILRLLIDGRIKKIFVSVNSMRWGHIDMRSKSISYNMIQKNHKDDDILDDITELAIRNGVEVRVVNDEHLPKNCDIIATR